MWFFFLNIVCLVRLKYIRVMQSKFKKSNHKNSFEGGVDGGGGAEVGLGTWYTGRDWIMSL